MAKDEYLEIDALDTTTASEKLSMALIYLTTVCFVVAIILFQLKMKDLGVGLLAD